MNASWKDLAPLDRNAQPSAEDDDLRSVAELPCTRTRTLETFIRGASVPVVDLDVIGVGRTHSCFHERLQAH